MDLLLRLNTMRTNGGGRGVAIPVVVDLLLRLYPDSYLMQRGEVAIPVVVDLLLRQYKYPPSALEEKCRNPCCSGPTA